MMTRSFSVIKHSAVPAALGALVAFLVCAHGLPLLRHDWTLPQTPQALSAAWEATFQPLLLRGFGETNPYPTAYLAGFVSMPLTVLPPVIFTWLVVALITASAAAAGAAIARSLGANGLAQSACALFAALNPWMYTELVAGHVLMVMSYGFLLWLVAEALRPRPRAAWLVVWCALAVSQIEFLTFAFIPLAIWLIRKRLYLPLFALCIATVPIAFGIVAHYADIRTTPFLLEWQVSQSIDILDALVLRGYSTQYASAFAFVAPALWIAAAAAVAATVLGFMRRSPGWVVLLLGWCAIVFATGTKWVVAPLYDFAVLHVAEIGVFRELYDLLAIAAIAYTVGVASVSKLHRYAAPIMLAAGAALVYAWIVSPPFTHFVPQHLVPAQDFAGTDQERVALYPALQPLKLRGNGGSGYDPDLFYQPGRAIPINSYFPAFPQVGALEAALSGDFSQLSALSVHYVLGRPYLEQNTEALRYEMIAPRKSAVPRTRTLDHRYPMLGIDSGYPIIVTIGRLPFGNGVFYGDLSSGSVFRIISSPRLGTDADAGWIDARLAYASYPFLATRFGGVFTRGRAPLSLPRNGRAVLAWTNGRLRDPAGPTVATASPSLQWHVLPARTRSLVCTGSCMVVAVGDPPPFRAEAPAARPAQVAFTWIMPWLVRAAIPQHPDSTLRWNMRYERSWRLIGTRSLAHVAVDQVVNAWMVPAGAATRAYLINTYAAIQAALEVCSFLLICALAWRATRHA